LKRIGRIWSVILRREITAREVALCMVGLKLARETKQEGRATVSELDNLVDMAGYLRLIELAGFVDEEKKLAE
jgi:hypothetical protein